MNQRKLAYYLNAKCKDEYSQLDQIFEKYHNGEIYAILAKCSFSDIEFFYQLNQGANYLQVYCHYSKWNITVEFDEEGIQYCTYLNGETISDELFKKISYNEEFNVEQFINDLHKELCGSSRLEKNTEGSKQKEIFSRSGNSQIAKIVLLSILLIVILGILLSSVLIDDFFEKTFDIRLWAIIIFILYLCLIPIISSLKAKRGKNKKINKIIKNTALILIILFFVIIGIYNFVTGQPAGLGRWTLVAAAVFFLLLLIWF